MILRREASHVLGLNQCELAKFSVFESVASGAVLRAALEVGCGRILQKQDSYFPHRWLTVMNMGKHIITGDETMADQILLLEGTGAFTLCSGLLESGRFVRMPFEKESASSTISLKGETSRKKAFMGPEDPDSDPDDFDTSVGGLMSGYKVMGQERSIAVVLKVLKSHSADFLVGTPAKDSIPVECRASRKKTMAVLEEIRSAL